MTPATSPTSPAAPAAWADWCWPGDVQAFAREHGAEAYLEPLREALARLFPNATRAWVSLAQDPELRDVRSIDFEVHIPDEDVADGKALYELYRLWHAEVLRVVPCPKLSAFTLFLTPVPNDAP